MKLYVLAAIALSISFVGGITLGRHTTSSPKTSPVVVNSLGETPPPPRNKNSAKTSAPPEKKETAAPSSLDDVIGNLERALAHSTERGGISELSKLCNAIGRENFSAVIEAVQRLPDRGKKETLLETLYGNWAEVDPQCRHR